MNIEVWSWKRNILVGIVVAAVAVGVEVYISIYSEYFLWHVRLPNMWGLLNLPALLFTLILGAPDAPAVGYIAIFLQWFVIGFALSFYVTALKSLAAMWRSRKAR